MVRFTLDVRAFGARGDGKADDTQAIQAALYACPADGRVLVPAGRYRFRSLFFRSHTRFELAAGAVLEAMPEREGRAILPGFCRDFKGGKFYMGSWEGNPLDCYAGLLTLLDVEDVLIYGEGTIDGGGAAWWEHPKEKIGAWRPRTVFMRRCRRITIQGITIKNSPSWTIHPLESEELDFVNVTIENPWDSPNTDGINPESCDGVRILGCRFSLGDDCIAIKSGKISMADRPCRHIEIRNCLMENGHGAVTIGSETAGGVYDVTVSDCEFRRTDRGLRIKTRRGRGEKAVVTDVTFRNIKMDGVDTPVVVNMFYYCDPDGHSEYVQSKLPVGGPVPTVGMLIFENIEALNCGKAAVFAYGLPERPIERLELRHVRFTFADERTEGSPAMLDDADWTPDDLVYIRNVKAFITEDVEIS